MSTRQFRLAASALSTVAAVAAFAPATSYASPERASFEACVSAFAKSITPAGAPVPAYKVIYRSNDSSGTLSRYFATEFTYDLEANDPKTHAVRARARCSTDLHGTVSALSPLPLDEKPQAIAAR